MLIWVVGKKGILASAFSRILKGKGVEFVATSRSEVDVTDRNAICSFYAKYRPTHIVNCSGYTAVDRAESEEAAAYALNSFAPAFLAELPAHLVHFSTDYVFNGMSTVPYTEEDEVSPLNVYGRSKRDGEVAVLKLGGSVIRISWLFGKEGVHFVGKMAELLTTKESIRVVSDQVGKPTYADDVVGAALALIDHGEAGLFHYAGDKGVSWYGFALAIQETLGLSCKVVPITSGEFPAVARRPLSSLLDTSKIEKSVGKTPSLWQNRLREVLL